MPTGEDAHGSDYFTPVFLLPQLCNSTFGFMLDEAESGAFIAFEDDGFLVCEDNLRDCDHSLRVNNPGEVDAWLNTLIQEAFVLREL
ncbi:hypothetical protein [Corynebacterium glutamicum]|uniref:hypothetical protein n=1 Tax=Corynebacterium glutamicum TaxID=1718 RepID=UPI000965346E|nr:hypothetical protein [Corynebacterium glutamicum]OKX79949.1 hypothetical protein AUO95_12255 [Corynebacterium glutamicum]